MKRSALFVSVIVVLAATILETACAQQTEGKWMIGLSGGPNVWVSDFNKLQMGFGGEFLLGYGLDKYFSLGLTAGYEELKTNQQPILTDLDYGYQLGAVKLKAMPVSIIGILHLSPGSNFNPYVYAGVGSFSFKRSAASTVYLPGGASLPAGSYLPDSKYRTALMIPVGVGFEFFASKSLSVDVNLGARSFGNWIDFRQNKSIDGMLTGKAGVRFYIGRGDDDDDDMDGLTNIEERRYGADESNPDTDNDGLKDGEEVKRYRSNPLRSDTDSDGIADGAEALQYASNPAKGDSDGDGLSDGDEALRLKSDPLKPDSDGDLLSDGDEVLIYKSHPLKVDTDADGLSDYDEVITYKSDPIIPDTDKDGLLDGEEVRVTRTDPVKADTDKGGAKDGDEVYRAMNPLDATDDHLIAPIQLEKGKTVVLGGVTFESGSAKLTKASEPALQKALQALERNPRLRVEIAGHTDSQGQVSTNDRLSKSRAEAVKSWLVVRGIAANRLTTVGQGSRSPIASNLTAEGRAKNRRIEFQVK